MFREEHNRLDLVRRIISLVLADHLANIHHIRLLTLLLFHLDEIVKCNPRVFTDKVFGAV